jgi:hypothetical protein
MKRGNSRITGNDMKQTNCTNSIATLRVTARSRALRGLAARACLCLALGAPLFAQPAHAQASDAVPNSEIGHSTLAWLELQRSNAQAAPALPMLGAEAGYAYRRYLKSFDTQIPASFGSSIDAVGGTSNLAPLNSSMGSGGSN